MAPAGDKNLLGAIPAAGVSIAFSLDTGSGGERGVAFTAPDFERSPRRAGGG